MTKKNILIVDDEPSITRLLGVILEKSEQYVVRLENDANNVLGILKEFKPDLILLDVMMPGMDGGQLAEKIRRLKMFSSVPIVFLTGAVRQEELDARNGMIGGFPYIAKPLNIKGAINIIEKSLSVV